MSDEKTAAASASSHKEKKEKKSSSSSKEGAVEKAKKNLASKAATSSFGKKLLTKVMDDQANTLMKSVKKLIELQSDSKKSKEIQNNIIRLLVKAQRQLDSKKVTEEQLAGVDRPLRKSFRRIIRITELWNEIKGDPAKLDENFDALQSHLRDIEKVIMDTLNPFLTDKNKSRFGETFNFISNKEFLKKMWFDDKSTPELQKISCVMSHYLKNPSRAPKDAGNTSS
eukprot:TRINITY_DN10952_c0_g1_i1.p1 TRINITY_DN10952_c0_g1~~TRINITY_DN10952_c0_g1_i1.p1  ORF type:complete len:247 (-),score=120.68 TRINITY_DN10952_c0_g1_i1:202-879(-)